MFEEIMPLVSSEMLKIIDLAQSKLKPVAEFQAELENLGQAQQTVESASAIAETVRDMAALVIQPAQKLVLVTGISKRTTEDIQRSLELYKTAVKECDAFLSDPIVQIFIFAARMRIKYVDNVAVAKNYRQARGQM